MAESRTQALLSLADAIAECPGMATVIARDDIVGLLEARIRNGIQRRDEVRSDVLNIVKRCADFEAGIEQLLEIVGHADGQTLQWKRVLVTAEAFRRADAAERQVAGVGGPADGRDARPVVVDAPPAASLSPAAGSVLPGLGRPAGGDAPGKAPPRSPKKAPGGSGATKLALVIGISRYLHHKPPGQLLEPREFGDLGCAASDALAFGDFLAEDGSYEVLEPLLDEKATRRNILASIDRLRALARQAPEANPLVIVYFAGHGAMDGQGRHFLVPYDAERDNLFATALWTRSFDMELAEVDTNRLVMFVDACHGGATAVAAEGVRDSEPRTGVLRYDPSQLVAEPSAARRRVVASCEAGQFSYEFDGAGLFTRHLLSLLRFEQPGEFNSEEIDLWDLYGRLKERVRASATERLGQEQAPFSSFKKPTGVIIAVDPSLRKRREQRELSYLEVVQWAIVDSGHPQSESIVSRLARHVGERETLPGFESLYRMFRQKASAWEPDTDIGLDVRDLCWAYENSSKAATPRPRPSLPNAAPAESQAAGLKGDAPGRVAGDAPRADAFAPTPAADTLRPGGNLATPSGPAPAALGGSAPAGGPGPDGTTAEERRRFSDSDRAYVRHPLWNLEFQDEGRALDALLERQGGLSLDQLNDWLMRTRPIDPAAAAGWRAAAKEVFERARQRWAAAEPVREVRSALSLRSWRGGGRDV